MVMDIIEIIIKFALSILACWLWYQNGKLRGYDNGFEDGMKMGYAKRAAQEYLVDPELNRKVGTKYDYEGDKSKVASSK